MLRHIPECGSRRLPERVIFQDHRVHAPRTLSDKAPLCLRDEVPGNPTPAYAGHHERRYGKGASANRRAPSHRRLVLM